MTHLVLIGARGFIGSHFLASRASQFVRALSRKSLPNVSLQSGKTEWVTGDLNDPAIWSKLLQPNCVVVNLAYAPLDTIETTIAATRAMVEACAANKIHRLIHCSTISVFGRTTGDSIDEATACNPLDVYGLQKLAIERTLHDSVKDRFELAVLRPSAVFGEGGHALQALCESLMSRPRLMNYVRSSLFGLRRMHLIPVENVVAALNFLCNLGHVLKGDVFIASEDHDPSNNFRSVEQLLMKELQLADYSMPPAPVPRSVLQVLLRLRGRSEIDPRCTYESTKLRELGFVPPIGLVPAIQATGKRFRESLRSDVTQ